MQPGTYTLKFLARENETGKMGTFETKFVVPDLTTGQKYLPISSVVLSYQREKLDTAVASAEKDKKLIAANPLVRDSQKLIPSVTRVFRKDQEMYVYLEAYQPAAEKTQPMVATVSFYRGKVKAFETAPLQITDGLNAKSKAVPVSFSVPLAKLQPGRYTCQVSVVEPRRRSSRCGGRIWCCCRSGPTDSPCDASSPKSPPDASPEYVSRLRFEAAPGRHGSLKLRSFPSRYSPRASTSREGTWKAIWPTRFPRASPWASECG